MRRRMLMGVVGTLAMGLIALVALAVLGERTAAPGGRAGAGMAPVAWPADVRHPGTVGGVEPSRENVAPGFAREVAALERQLAADTADTAALLRLARLNQDGHRPAAAVGYYRRYLRRAAWDRQAWLDLAAAAAADGDWGGALDATKALFERDSLDPAVLFNLGAIHANRGDTAVARAWWLKAASQTRDPPLAQQAQAALAKLGGR